VSAPGRPTVAIIHGAIPPDAAPDERDTLVQAAEVGEGLRALGYAVAAHPVGLDLSRLHGLLLPAPRPALVFNLVEALEGQGRLIHLPACVLDALGLPYTGAPSRALFATTDKPLAKALMAGAGIPTPAAWTPASRGPFIVKSAHEDASIGLDDGSVVPARSVPALIEARRRRFGGEWFAEAYVEGREFNQPMLEGEDGKPELLPLGEMEFVGWAPGRPRRQVGPGLARLRRHPPHLRAPPRRRAAPRPHRRAGAGRLAPLRPARLRADRLPRRPRGPALGPGGERQPLPQR
jgi:D-alanine-D-alanine ligase